MYMQCEMSHGAQAQVPYRSATNISDECDQMMSESAALYATHYHRISDSSPRGHYATNIPSESAALTKLHTFHHHHHIILFGDIDLVHVSIDVF